MTLYHVLITGLWISCCYSQTISGPLSVSLNPPNLDHVIWERSTFTVQCTAICSPNPCTFSWTKDGVEVSNTSHLFFGSMNKEKAGKYVCTARNTVSGATNISGTLMIEVYYGPDNRQITLNPSNLLYTILEGQTLANITCSADCNPVCSFIWRKSGIMVSNTGVLPLGSVTRNHAGSYECTANNEHIGRSASSWPVVIKIIYGPDSATLSLSALFYSTTEGNTISDITCSATCLPDKCSFSWTKSGTEVSNSSVLSLGYAQRNMAGNYVCTAKNPGSLYNISTGTFVLEIAYGPENITLSPVIKSYTLNEGQILNNITCSAKCVPECTFSWKRSYTVMMNNTVSWLGKER
ncbi:hypothetical protein DPMN_141186 [Dreissena polymorpha]|uniref:Ig-like domain-containing protein n=1 Tax=Dreissena polymorpha TaxID=45954 RepID=A0A9D4GEY0_DREPO|nr:hypothetical protein DPMN_141186 [Dreissena polymorpha]